MPLPANVDLGYVSGTFTKGDGTPAAGGTITFKPAPSYLLDRGSTPPTTILPTPVAVTLDANGQIPTTTQATSAGKVGQHLVASLDTDLDPTGWTWNVSFLFSGGSRTAFDFVLDVGEQLDLTTLGPAAPSTGISTGGLVLGIGIKTIRKMTQTAYNGITPDPDTLYVIV
jgi:hypothetical protein